MVYHFRSKESMLMGLLIRGTTHQQLGLRPATILEFMEVDTGTHSSATVSVLLKTILPNIFPAWPILRSLQRLHVEL